MSRSRKAPRGRNDETRGQINNPEDHLNISFSFKYFMGKDRFEVGQEWDDWGKKPIKLVKLLKKLQHLCNLNPTQAKDENSLSIYGPFPEDSKFTCPDHLQKINRWGVIKKIGSGSKVRVAGYYEGQSIFQIVFLDENHHFWPSDK